MRDHVENDWIGSVNSYTIRTARATAAATTATASCMFDRVMMRYEQFPFILLLTPSSGQVSDSSVCPSVRILPHILLLINFNHSSSMIDPLPPPSIPLLTAAAAPLRHPPTASTRSFGGGGRRVSPPPPPPVVYVCNRPDNNCSSSSITS